MKQEKFLLHCDNQSVIHLAKNVIYHSRTKHIQRMYHWLRERVDENEFGLAKIHIDDNGSDMITKILSMEKLVACWRKTGLVNSPHTGVKGEFFCVKLSLLMGESSEKPKRESVGRNRPRS